MKVVAIIFFATNDLKHYLCKYEDSTRNILFSHRRSRNNAC